MKTLRNNNGYTLIELMIVIVIIAILAAVSAPSVRDMINQAALKNIANTLMNDLKMARSHAVKSSQEVGVFFNTEGNNYFIENCGNDNTCAEDPDPFAADDVIIKEVDLTNYSGSFLTISGEARFGSGPAPVDATVGATSLSDAAKKGVTFVDFGNGNRVFFNSNGMPTLTGYVYLTNQEEKRCYAVGISSRSGVIKMRINTGEEWKTL